MSDLIILPILPGGTRVDHRVQRDQYDPLGPCPSPPQSGPLGGVGVVEKAACNFAEADWIRDLLAVPGFEVRDRKDGVVEVVGR